MQLVVFCTSGHGIRCKVQLSIHLHVCTAVCTSTCLYSCRYIYMSVQLSVHLHVCTAVGTSTCLYSCQYIYMPVQLSIHLHACTAVNTSTCLYSCQYIYIICYCFLRTVHHINNGRFFNFNHLVYMSISMYCFVFPGPGENFFTIVRISVFRPHVIAVILKIRLYFTFFITWFYTLSNRLTSKRSKLEQEQSGKKCFAQKMSDSTCLSHGHWQLDVCLNVFYWSWIPVSCNYESPSFRQP